MNLPIIIYLADVASAVIDLAVHITIISALVLLCLLLIRFGLWWRFFFMQTEQQNQKLLTTTKKYLKFVMISLIVSIVILIFIPSKSTIYLMIGISKVEDIINTPEASKVLRIINLELDKQLKNLENK
jgi:heme/copper-type cytochrome/quinol oxidase subunit 2